MASTDDTTSERAARRAQQVKERRAQNAEDRSSQRHRQYDKNRRELTIIKIVAGVVAVGILAAIGLSIWNWGQDRELNREPTGARSYPYAGNQHREGAIDYTLETDYQQEIPPAGGTHNPEWQQCDVYDGPIRWENAVHTIEHGAIWIAYRPDIAAADIETLRGLGSADEMLVAPEPNLTAPIVLTAWGKQLSADSADDENIRRFIRFYKNNPDLSQEWNANCTSGSTALRP